MNLNHWSYSFPSTLTIGSFQLKIRDLIFLMMLLGISLGMDSCGDPNFPTGF